MHLDKKIYNIDTYKNIDVKIVQISDIHFSIDYNLKKLYKTMSNIEKIKPDYVCIVGDLIDEYDVVKTNYINYFKDWLRLLSYKYKVIISLGNHDFLIKEYEGYVEHNNIDWLLELRSKSLVVLNDEVYSENGINFIGYNPNALYYRKYDYGNILKCNGELSELIINRKGYNILMIHTPFFIVSDNNYEIVDGFLGIDLVISGHTHGGLMPSFIPGNFGLVSPTKSLFPKNVRGMVRCGKCDIIISSGVVKLSRKSKITVLNDFYGYNINVINIKKV